MKKFVTPLLLSVVLSSPVMAGSGHGHNDDMQGAMKGKGMENSQMSGAYRSLFPFAEKEWLQVF